MGAHERVLRSESSLVGRDVFQLHRRSRLLRVELEEFRGMWGLSGRSEAGHSVS